MVDYRQFRLSRIREPRFSHALLWLTWVVYFVLYFLTENLIPAERCHVMHCFLDDLMPFCEYFAIFYVGWYLLVAGSLAYTLFYDVESFKKLQTFIMITQGLAMLCYIFYPSVQYLRPESFPRQNVFAWFLDFLYTFDTPTGVCPSLHVAYSLGILSVTLKDRQLNRGIKAAVAVFVFMVCLSVCFIKQHSSIDALAALPVCLIAEIALYGKDYWLPKLRKNALTEKK